MSETYNICVSGCDDSTEVQMVLSDEEAAVLARVAENITNASTYGCMPTMSVSRIEGAPHADQ